MPDAPKKPDPTTLKLTVTDTGTAPYVYFEGAPNFGFVNGIISITLAANRHLLRDGAPVTDAVAIAHLRSPPSTYCLCENIAGRRATSARVMMRSRCALTSESPVT
jgi:hypothetical protein